MMFSLAVPAFAGVSINETRSQIPVIRISGDGDALYNQDGEKIFHFREIGSMLGGDEEDEENSELMSSMANVLLPFLVEGLLNDKWDNYYKNLEKEISELFADARLDGNGNPVNGTGLSQHKANEVANNMKTDKKGNKGYYAHNDYWFWYDWRLDPLKTADDFNDYIKAVKAVTGAEKVSILASCLGTSIVTAYVAKYGMDDIHGIGFDGSVVGGAEILSETISGKFKVDGNAINRVLIDSTALGFFSVDSFVNTTIDMLTKTGILDTLVGVTKKELYYKVVEGVTSALALSTFYTWPTYWSAVSADDFDDAMLYVFGEEGSEKRKEYAGLIEQIENYDKVVRQNLESILLSFKQSGANVGIISKYGYQILPICESSDAVADQFASVKRSSFGATTSTIYNPLLDEYIGQRIIEGKEKYISPDKQIDASTCLYPDYTWFIKGSTHSNWSSYEMKILYDVITADRQLTPEDFPWTQFMVYDTETDTLEAMTEENCDTELWEADESVDKPQTKEERLSSAIKALLTWLFELFKILSEKFEASEIGR